MLVELNLSELIYVVQTGVPLGLVGTVLGYQSQTVSIGTIPSNPLTATNSDTLRFEMPVQGDPADL